MEKILQLDVPTKNGTTYTTECISAMLKTIKPEIFGQIGMATFVDLEKVSHVCTNFKIEDGWLQCDIKVLDTPCGKILKDMNGGNFAASGIGNIDTDKIVSNYELTGVHYVMNRS
jgi:hypothetical protein